MIITAREVSAFFIGAGVMGILFTIIGGLLSILEILKHRKEVNK